MIRSYLAALGLAALSVPAAAACQHLHDGVVVDANGAVVMEVIPSCDSELDDPSFNPPGLSQVRVLHQSGVTILDEAAQASPLVASSLSAVASAALSAALSASAVASLAQAALGAVQ